MLKLSKKTEYALIAIMHIAKQHEGKTVSAKKIAEEYALPSELVGKILQSLAKAGFVTAFQGARGGYKSALPLDKISLGALVEAVDGRPGVTSCKRKNGTCYRIGECNLIKAMEYVQQKLIDDLYSISLSDLSKITDQDAYARSYELSECK